MKRKNPFRGIACSNGSSYGPQFFRHIEGARDPRASFSSWHERGRPFRDTNTVPVLFTGK